MEMLERLILLFAWWQLVLSQVKWVNWLELEWEPAYYVKLYLLNQGKIEVR